MWANPSPPRFSLRRGYDGLPAASAAFANSGGAAASPTFGPVGALGSNMGQINQKLMMAAFSAALRAIVGKRIESHEVIALGMLADERLEPDAPFLEAVTLFVDGYRAVRHDAASLSQAGAQLWAAIDRELQWRPVDHGRADIYG